MAVTAAVKFVQAATIGLPGQALFGTLVDGLVTVSNGNNANVVRWKFEVLDVPPGSAVPVGVVQDGALSTYTFLPDLRGGYLVRLTVYSSGNVTSAHDARTFGVKEASTRFIPSFCPRTEFGDDVLNFGGQTRGWAKYMEEWLHAVDAAAALVYGHDLDPASVSGNQIVNALTGVAGEVVVRGAAAIAFDTVGHATVGNIRAKSAQVIIAAREAGGVFDLRLVVTDGANVVYFGDVALNGLPAVLVGTPAIVKHGAIEIARTVAEGLTITTAKLILGLIGPTLTTGAGVPVMAEPDGSAYLRTNGTGASDGVYTRQGGVWYAVGSGGIPVTRTLTAGAGLTGGGDLSADRTFDVVANADGSIVVNANDIQVGILATDGQHGVRGGGTQHAVVVPAGAAGFMSGADKTKLDGIPPGGGAPTYGLDLDPTSVSGAQKVIAATGSGGIFEVRDTASKIQWDATTVTPKLLQAAPAADLPTTDMVIQSQAPFLGAVVNPDPGNLALITPAEEFGGTAGTIDLRPGGATKVRSSKGSTAFATGHKIALDDINGAGPKFYASPGVPVAADADGSLFLREDGVADTTAYVRAAGAWYALASSAAIAANWSPLLLTYLRGWYIADLEYVVGVAWGDQSPVGNDLIVSGTAAGAALNGHATVTFDAVGDMAKCSPFSLGRASKLSMFAVVKSTSTASYRMIMVYVDGGHEVYSNTADGKIGGDTGGVLFTGTTVITGAFHQVGATEDATGNMLLYVDGVNDGSNASGAAIPTTGDFTIGARSDTSIGLIGDVAEVVVGAAVWTASEIALLKAYWSAKYGI